MFWKINIKYSFLFLMATSNLVFAGTKKSVDHTKNEKIEPKELISKGDGYEFKYTKDWDLTEDEDGWASLRSKKNKALSIGVTLLPKTYKSMQSYLEDQGYGNPRKRFVFGEISKVDGRDAALILEVDREGEKDVDAEHRQSFGWSTHFFCANQIFSIGYGGHLSKEERAEARKQRVPPKEFQEFLQGFKCLKD